MTSRAGSFELLCTRIEPATRISLQLDLDSENSFSTSLDILNGRNPGPVLCITAAIHGNEINGIEIVRNLLNDIDLESLRGVIVGIPVVNREGYCHRVRHIGDHHDLNRCFPGSEFGTYPERVAHSLFTKVILNCDAVVDIHTGSSGRENLPQMRVDLSIEGNAEFSSKLSHLAVLQNKAPKGSLREASTLAGIPAVVIEIGGSRGLEQEKVQLGIKALRSLLHAAEMVNDLPSPIVIQHIYYGGGWIRAEIGGIFISKVELGDEVKPGKVIAEIINPISSSICKVKAPLACTILARSHNQFVEAGTGLFRVGIEQKND